jgi:hypothetical protein
MIDLTVWSKLLINNKKKLLYIIKYGFYAQFQKKEADQLPHPIPYMMQKIIGFKQNSLNFVCTVIVRS